jgi:cellulose synthase/poly-beta-1,6-N-acetylglucosamine synthase-like glycosyltransferase
MKISVIIPVKPGGAVRALESLQHLDADSPDHEIMVAEGRKPSRQRNAAAAAASGDILYFLDDDALAVPDALKRLVRYFGDEKVAVVGGPSVTPADDSPLQQAIAWVLASLFGGGAIRNRYRRHGMLRRTDDRELILCNLAFRRQTYLECGGLDERLYPNEENELIDRLRASGADLLHDPDLYVTRSQRPTLKAYVRQMLTYGRGRAEQTLLTGTIGFKPLIPALFVLYLLSLPIVAQWWYTVPALCYLAALAGNMVLAAGSGKLSLVLRLPIIYTLLHVCYGVGFLLGLLRPRFRSAAGDEPPVVLRREKAFAAAAVN